MQAADPDMQLLAELLVRRIAGLGPRPGAPVALQLAQVSLATTAEDNSSSNLLSMACKQPRRGLESVIWICFHVIIDIYL